LIFSLQPDLKYCILHTALHTTAYCTGDCITVPYTGNVSVKHSKRTLTFHSPSHPKHEDASFKPKIICR
jgi:hypothetical protein